jgi:hypothetical protein
MTQTTTSFAPADAPTAPLTLADWLIEEIESMRAQINRSSGHFSLRVKVYKHKIQFIEMRERKTPRRERLDAALTPTPRPIDTRTNQAYKRN